MDSQKQLILDTVATYIKNVDLYTEKNNNQHQQEHEKH